MRTENIKIKLRDGTMGAYVAYPDKTPVGAVIAIMEIWGVNDTMRKHAHEFAEAGFVCLVPDLFWRQEPGVELSDHNPDHVQKAFDLYYEFDYDLGVRDMEDTWRHLEKIPECNGKVGAVGFCMSGGLTIALAKAMPDRIAAAASIHGAWLVRDTPDSPHLDLRGARAEVYFAWCDNDETAPADTIPVITAALDAAGVVNTVDFLTEAEHGFAPAGPRYDRAASELHWERVHSLLRRNL